MGTDTQANDDRLFVALTTFKSPGNVQNEDEFAPFGTYDDAREWAEEQLREMVARYGSGCDFRVDVARVDRADFDADTWGVADGNMVARATWDSDAESVAWQNDGPFEFDDKHVTRRAGG
ncbi:hypothetical protein GZH49_12690 [Nocardia terpenica]|uniref:hypothetical protein n=1 Tax=Nocardia terpenica TaxID=455432 RepID=UPI002FE184C1